MKKLLVALMLAGCAHGVVKFPDQSEDGVLWACWHKHAEGQPKEADLTCVDFVKFLRYMRENGPSPIPSDKL